MNSEEAIKKQWEKAAPGWAKWEKYIAAWTKPATEAMLDMAGIVAGAKVLDLACGAGSQTIEAARRTGKQGHVLACDISETMLHYVRDQAHTAHLDNISTKVGAAEALDVPYESFDAAICRLGLMLFVDPAKALGLVRRSLKPGGKLAVMVFSTPEANAIMVKPMQILLRHAHKKPPAAGQPGIFALGAPGILKNLLEESGFTNIKEQKHPISLHMTSVAQTLEMMQEGWGAYRAVISDCPEEVRKAAWSEVAEMLKGFETEKGFQASGEVVVAGGRKPDYENKG